MIFRTSRRGTRAVLAAGCVAALTAGTAVVATPAAAASAEARFIITVSDEYDSRAVAAEHRRKGAEIDYVYTHALNGFAGSMSQAELGELQRDRRVTRIERDGIARVTDTQSGATWGLDRIDQRSGTNGTYTYTTRAATATAYIIDTGIRSTHVDFGSRVTGGFTAINDDRGTEDCNGHGTHVAGTVGGSVYGVAKDVKLVPVRVLDCNGSGTWAGVAAGLDWVAGNAGGTGVANMSLGGGANTSVDDAVRRTIASGVSVVVAAGNGNQGGKEQDACNYSPARVQEAVTIGATTDADVKTSWSNYGPCVDFFAPGAGITSAWHTSNTSTNTISGTSMAAPHVAGVAALYLSENAGALPQTVRDALYAATTKDVVTSSKTANNHLLYSPYSEYVAAPAPAPAITLTVTGTKTKTSKTAHLTWTTTGAPTVDVFRNGSMLYTTDNDGTHDDSISGKGGGTFTYKVCEAGSTAVCSNEASVTF